MLPAIPPWVPVTIQRPGWVAGHQLRNQQQFPPATATQKTSVLIVGSGIAGLSAAWRLRQRGHSDFILLSGPEPCGNAAGGQWNGIGYPTGAHYLPLPTQESHHVRQLLQELGLIKGDPWIERPQYDERFLLHSNAERLLEHGHWHDSLHPRVTTVAGKAQWQRFHHLIQSLKRKKGSDGKVIFAIPVVLSSDDPQWRALDRLYFGEWLQQQGFTDPGLRWYLDYCCRDDYGLDASQVSAWAGLHYFCSRTGQGKDADEDSLLTWPEGLQGLIGPMQQACAAQTVDGFALRIEEGPQGASVLCQSSSGSVWTIEAERVICATPLHITARLLDLRSYGFDPRRDQPQRAPWLVANVYLNGFPDEQPGEELSWDNVISGSSGLGYVVATHQWIRAAKPERTVFTVYRALSEGSPDLQRQWLHTAPAHELTEIALADLKGAYGTQLWRYVDGVEITVRGHAMAAPAPGYLSQPGLRALREYQGHIVFAHSDLSGYSVCEEALWWGERAALLCLGTV